MFALFIGLDAGFINLCVLLNLRRVERGLQKPFKGRIPQVQNQYVAFKLVSTQERTVS